MKRLILVALVMFVVMSVSAQSKITGISPFELNKTTIESLANSGIYLTPSNMTNRDAHNKGLDPEQVYYIPAMEYKSVKFNWVLLYFYDGVLYKAAVSYDGDHMLFSKNDGVANIVAKKRKQIMAKFFEPNSDKGVLNGHER